MENKTSTIIKLVTFKIADYWMALPMKAILKIVNCPSPNQGGITPLGIVQLGSHTIHLLDLNSVFCFDTYATSPQSPQFLLVLCGIQNRLWGIALESPPDLIELPISEFQAISTDSRFASKKRWISHVAVLAEQEISRTLLLLDLKAALQPELVKS